MSSKKFPQSIITDLKKQGATKITLFGSYARNQQKKKSDLDLIVEFKPKKSFLELVRIERELSENNGIKIDLLTKKSISPHILKSIKDDMKVIYG